LQAIEQFKKVLELESNFYVAHIFLGLAYVRIGHLPEAIDEFKMAQAQSVKCSVLNSMPLLTELGSQEVHVGFRNYKRIMKGCPSRCSLELSENQITLRRNTL
jgi:hypothetical protein